MTIRSAMEPEPTLAVITRSPIGTRSTRLGNLMEVGGGGMAVSQVLGLVLANQETGIRP